VFGATRLVQEERLGEIVTLREADAGRGLQIGELLEGLDASATIVIWSARPSDSIARRTLWLRGNAG